MVRTKSWSGWSSSSMFARSSVGCTRSAGASTSTRVTLLSGDFFTHDESSLEHQPDAQGCGPRTLLAKLFPLRIASATSFWKRNGRSSRPPVVKPMEKLLIALVCANLSWFGVTRFVDIPKVVFCSILGSLGGLCFIVGCLVLHKNFSVRHLRLLMSTGVVIVLIILLCATVVLSALYRESGELALSIAALVLVVLYILIMDVALQVSWLIRVGSTIALVAAFSMSLLLHQMQPKKDKSFASFLGVTLWIGAVSRSTHVQAMLLGVRAIRMAFEDRHGDMMFFVSGQVRRDEVLASTCMHNVNEKRYLLGACAPAGTCFAVCVCLGIHLCATFHAFPADVQSSVNIAAIVCSSLGIVCWVFCLRCHQLLDVMRHKLSREMRVWIGVTCQLVVLGFTASCSFDSNRYSTVSLIAVLLPAFLSDCVACNVGMFRLFLATAFVVSWLAILYRHLSLYNTTRQVSLDHISIPCFPTVVGLDIQILTVAMESLWVVLRDPNDIVFNAVQKPHPKEEKHFLSLPKGQQTRAPAVIFLTTSSGSNQAVP